jgi:AcrR family transcriptional regulator
MCLIKQRAKNPEQKALRRQQILDASRRLFETLSYEEVNLNHVASDVGISKAALYRYFRNKETLFLALFVEALNALAQSFEQAIKQNIKKQTSLAVIVTNSLVENPIYCKLSAILHTILERNLTLDEAKEFKLHLLSLMNKYSQLLGQHPEFKNLNTQTNTNTSPSNENNALSFLMQVQQVLIGVWHMTHPTGAIAQVIELEPLIIFKQDFSKTLLSHIMKLTNAQNVQ